MFSIVLNHASLSDLLLKLIFLFSEVVRNKDINLNIHLSTYKIFSLKRVSFTPWCSTIYSVKKKSNLTKKSDLSKSNESYWLFVFDFLLKSLTHFNSNNVLMWILVTPKSLPNLSSTINSYWTESWRPGICPLSAPRHRPSELHTSSRPLPQSDAVSVKEVSLWNNSVVTLIPHS